MADEPAVVEIWDRLARPIDHQGVVAALLGLNHNAVELLGAALLALSPEAQDLLDAMPKITRSMAVATVDQTERTIGQVRGPILWSETMAARASSFGDTGVFVCKSASRAYDTAENRVLAHALAVVYKAARTVDTQRAVGHHNEVARYARQVETRSIRHLDHRTLTEVPRTKPTGREMRRARSGTRRRTYAPAVAVLERASVPFDPLDVSDVADPATHGLHRLFADALAVADAATEQPHVRAFDGVLAAGPVSFRHPVSKMAPHHPPGVLIGDQLFVTAATAADAPDGAIVDPSPADLETALRQTAT